MKNTIDEMNEKMQTVITLYSLNVDIVTIANGVGLTVDEVKEILDELE